jgi:hypothetical protein
MDFVEQHHSPDRLIRLIITRDDCGDIAIGFAGYAWHTHGDILASLSGLPEKEATRKFVDQIIDDHQIIVVSRVNDEVRDIWPTDDPKKELKYKSLDELLEFRRWSGLVVQVSPS